ncbi:hypothetical protein AMTR_s00103p00152270 [Amborella trichopoda]|uniref:Uncharacterized protein n=1 Tax=Amborella trichopoda TaxID=13333 RepID=W1P1T0_AMBTC|nr:hypothetical protein AMTR_s00103p00152270 [Amborella trichopoda]
MPDLPALSIVSDGKKGLWILKAREKPLIKLLEYLRVKLMRKFAKTMAKSFEWSGVLILKAQNVINHRRDKSRFVHTVIWAHDVDMYRKTYSLPFSPMLDEHGLPEIVYRTVLPPATRRATGQPKKQCRQTKYKEIMPLKYSYCGVVGHSRKTSKSSI